MSPTPDARRPTLEAPIREQALKQLASETMPSSNTAHAVNAATKAMEEALVLVKMLPSSLGGSERDTAAMEGFLDSYAAGDDLLTANLKAARAFLKKYNNAGWQVRISIIIKL